MPKWLFSLAAAVVCAFALTSAADAQNRKVTLNFGLSYVPIGNSPVFTVPRAMGFWAEEGLDVEIQHANGSGPALQQLIAGQVDAAVAGFPPAFSLIEQGAPVKIVASINSRNIYYPVALETSKIMSIADMKGAKVGVLSAASSNVFWIKSTLKKHGLDPENDVEIIAVGAGPQALQALASGQIDVLQLFEASYDQIEQAGHPLRRFDGDEEFNKLAFTFGVVMRQDTIDNDPDLVEGLVRGIAKGIVYANAHPEDVVRMHWEYYPTVKPQGVSDEEAMAKDLPILKGALRNHQWAYEGKFGWAEPFQIEAVLTTLHEFEALKTALTPEQVFESKFVELSNDFDHDKLIAMPPKQ